VLGPNRDEYTEAWFWNVDRKKWDAVEESGKNFTMLTGEEFEVDEVLYLDMETGNLTTKAT
jgi:hypothetical protein